MTNLKLEEVGAMLGHKQSRSSLKTPPKTASYAASNSRRIRFSESPATVSAGPLIEGDEEDDILELWWQQRDYKTFRSSAQIQAQDLRVENPPCLKGLDEGYSTARYMATTTDESKVSALLKDVKKKKKAEPIYNWCIRGEGCRGLEIWASKSYFQARQEVVTESKAAVVELSQFNESPDEIAKQYQDYTRSSRIMARLLGEADAYAVDEIWKPVEKATSRKPFSFAKSMSRSERRRMPAQHRGLV